ncbi:hypothetical protein [Pedobacter nyackensis]|uniref:Uncharacterized protein n=1 Tax=Pedobacter nyackensis TaxID=475255 RepID=A0A1W2EHW5_9SPHI|nr:hypothetical protein [Pedobacter nyackensis]SMD09309.1 hypothetical protein SAMN04488101_112113 [Pedobacter nyackensis]
MSTQQEFKIEMDPNKLDSVIRSFNYDGNEYIYVCHLDKYSAISGGHLSDNVNQVKLLVKSFYGKYLNMEIPVNTFGSDEFYGDLKHQIDAVLTGDLFAVLD